MHWSTNVITRESESELTDALGVYALYASDLHLPSTYIALSDTCPLAVGAVAPPIRNEYNTNSSGLRRDFAITSLPARRPQAYLATLLTELSNRPYLVRGERGMIGKTREAGHQHQPKGNGPTVCSIGRPRSAKTIRKMGYNKC